MLAKVAVSAAVYAIDKPYSYRIPDGMPVAPGMRVMVPFGRGNRRTEGIVLSLEAGEETELKGIDQLLDDTPVLDGAMLRLAAFVRERYYCTFYQAIRAALPVGLWFQVRDTFELVPDCPWREKKIRQKDAEAVLQRMEDLGGRAQYADLRQGLEEDALQDALRYLLNKKWITSPVSYTHLTLPTNSLV